MPAKRTVIQELAKDGDYKAEMIRLDFESGKSWPCASLVKSKTYQGKTTERSIEFGSPNEIRAFCNMGLAASEVWEAWLQKKPIETEEKPF